MSIFPIFEEVPTQSIRPFTKDTIGIARLRVWYRLFSVFFFVLFPSAPHPLFSLALAPAHVPRWRGLSFPPGCRWPPIYSAASTHLSRRRPSIHDVAAS
ncbi:hypothetical protein DAI22_11g229050 [Oryza sativa Japonica Group]|nr:hypothetical protein DAI22_11g229050 [Oryza sativa Japonica Group]